MNRNLRPDDIFSAHMLTAQTENQRACIEVEAKWFHLGRPTVKLTPEDAAAFSETSIDIPSKHVRLPHEAFVIQLPVDAEFDFMEHFPAVRGILVGWANVPIPSACSRAIMCNVQFDKRPSSANFGWFESDFIHAFMADENMESRFMRMSTDATDPYQKKDEALGLEIGLKILRLAVCTAFRELGEQGIVFPDFTSRQDKYAGYRIKKGGK